MLNIGNDFYPDHAVLVLYLLVILTNTILFLAHPLDILFYFFWNQYLCKKLANLMELSEIQNSVN